MRRNAVAWAALALSVAALVGSKNFTRKVPAAQEIPAQGQKIAKELSDAFNAVAMFARPSVVQISVTKKGGAGGLGAGGLGVGGLKELLKRLHPDLNDDQLEELLKRQVPQRNRNRDNQKEQKGSPEKLQFGPFDAQPHGTGSGFVYDDQGHILTNNHVVSDATKIEVTFYDGDVAEAKVIGTDPDTDVAVIKVDNTSYRPLPKGDSDKLRVGEWVMSIGSPFGLSQTVTAGIISATERSDVFINKYESFIQTDCAINPGNSGGPLVDMTGHVVGVNSAIATAPMARSNAGVGFAIPMFLAEKVAEKLIKDGKMSRARVGIQLKPLNPAEARKLHADPHTHGVIAGDVLAGSPAEKAGLKTDDIVTGYDGHDVDSVQEFRILVTTSEPGKSYELKFLRDGKPQTAKITPAPEKDVVFAIERQQPEEKPEPAQPRRPERAERPRARSEGFGLGVKPLTAELAKQHGYPEGTEGLVIASVQEGSPAQAAGLEEGDLITKYVKGEKIEAARSAQDLKDAAGDGDELAIFVKDVRHPKDPAKLITLTKEKVGDL